MKGLGTTIESDRSLKETEFYCKMDKQGLIYETKPVGIKEFILSPEFLNLEQNVRPLVLHDLQELFCDETAFAYCPYEEAVFDEAIGTGKSYKTSISTCYYLYHLMCLEEPSRSFGLDETSMLTIMNMSINAMQAKKVVFGKIQNHIRMSKWFEKCQPNPNILSELQFPKNITIIPGHSGEMFPLGYDLICAIMDEAAFYTQTKTHDVAEDMYYTLKRRIKTRFGDKGLLIMISSPRYVDDFIERKMRESKGDLKIFCRRRTIWEAIPEDVEAIEKGETFELDNVKIPLKYRADFDKNPEKAWRDLGARPSMALEPYVKQMNLVEACVDPALKHPCDSERRFLPWFKGKEGSRYYIHVDLALSQDACGFAMGHYDGTNIIIDLMLQIRSVHQVEIDIQDVMDMIMSLKQRGFNLKKVTYDQFQSAGSIQQLKKKGIHAENLSVESMEAYDTFKEQLYMNKVRMYHFEPLLDELRRLELIKGKKVDHPVSGSKDVADAVCGVVYHIVTKELNRVMATVLL